MTNVKSVAYKIPYYGSIALLVYMPFHVFIVQSMSLLTGGLSIWKIAKDVLTALLTLIVICLVLKAGRTTRTFTWLVTLVVLYGVLHILVWLLHPHIYKPSAEIGLTYNLRVPCFAIIGYGAALLYPDMIKKRTVISITIWVSVVVSILGILQYFLPPNILTHVGYSLSRGVMPAFFIDSNPAFPRIMSTLRDPNSLGAYLILPIALCALLAISERNKKRFMYAAIVLVELAAVWLTYSRSALLAALVSIAGVVWWRYKPWFGIVWKRAWPVLIVLVMVFGFVGYSLRNNSQISHTTAAQTGQYDSNQLHLIFVKRGLEGILHRPFGHGPGTAGLASIQNPAGSFLTENYYIQIGYEVGVLGLLLFVAIQVVIYRQLLKQGSTVAVALMASFWGYVIMNMLLHTWSNEADACQWWLLAGAAMYGVGKKK